MAGQADAGREASKHVHADDCIQMLFSSSTDGTTAWSSSSLLSTAILALKLAALCMSAKNDIPLGQFPAQRQSFKEVVAQLCQGPNESMIGTNKHPRPSPISSLSDAKLEDGDAILRHHLTGYELLTS